MSGSGHTNNNAILLLFYFFISNSNYNQNSSRHYQTCRALVCVIVFSCVYKNDKLILFNKNCCFVVCVLYLWKALFYITLSFLFLQEFVFVLMIAAIWSFLLVFVCSYLLAMLYMATKLLNM